MTKEEFLISQPLVSKFYQNSVNNDHLPHAILLFGDNLSPIDEVAEFLAQSLFCVKHLACGHCSACQRFGDHRIGDFYSLDGRSTAIKKDQVNELAEQFVMTTKEQAHLAVYIIYEASNMTEEAANALLKFLEEPPSNVYALLTTTARESLMPTIISRVVALRVLPQKFVVEEGSINSKVLYLINSLRIKDDPQMISADPLFNSTYLYVDEFINNLLFSYEKGIAMLFSKISANLKDQTCYNYFYSMVYQIFMCVVTDDTDCPYKDTVIGLRNHKTAIYRAVIFLEEIIAARKLNYNFTLVLGKLATILEAQ